MPDIPAYLTLSPEQIKNWQNRHLLSAEGAAMRLMTTVGTFRNWISGRRSMPSSVALLMHYYDKYGPLIPDQCGGSHLHSIPVEPEAKSA
ncbi:helix-turn-helix domain-containing protein [Nitrospirillum amazonense]|uniref:helix-turn-helix domain-containing protein n=1 Tax=Nitrospirillum amazonense TaxID=28077 RepID=UPI0024121B7F|nr:hypothetical protein [Nitrospirillum amazonense]MDG3443726.1 hypothetical protein [Nitrospirillum amazonense]